MAGAARHVPDPFHEIGAGGGDGQECDGKDGHQMMG